MRFAQSHAAVDKQRVDLCRRSRRGFALPPERREGKIVRPPTTKLSKVYLINVLFGPL